MELYRLAEVRQICLRLGSCWRRFPGRDDYVARALIGCERETRDLGHPSSTFTTAKPCLAAPPTPPPPLRSPLSRPRSSNGLPRAPRPAQAELRQPRRLAAHVLDRHELFPETSLAISPAAPPGLCAHSSPQVVKNCRLPRYAAPADPTSAAAEGHRHDQRPHSRPGPVAVTWQLPLELREVGIPIPVRQSQSPVSGRARGIGVDGMLTAYNRLIAAGLVPLTVAPFAAGSLNPVMDSVLCALLVFHSHIGFEYVSHAAG